MSPERLALRRRLRAAHCDLHGFGRNRQGQLAYAGHIDSVIRTIQYVKDSTVPPRRRNERA